MRLWADVYNALGQRVEGPVNLKRARVTRVLDGAGSFEIDAQLLDDRARRLLTQEAKIVIWNEINNFQRRIGSGIINNRETKVGVSEYSLHRVGPDLLDELRRKSTLLRRKFNNTAIEAAEQLAALAGWTVVADEAVWPTVSMQFDSQSALNALITVANSVDKHIRLGEDERQVEIGLFGESISVLATNQIVNSAEIITNKTVLLIDSLTIGERSDAVYTWVIPYGSGQGADVVTLAEAYLNGTRPDVFAITGPDGDPLYGILDDDGYSQFGQIETVKDFPHVTLLTVDDAGRLAASNSLYDAARSWIKRQAQSVVTYKLSVKKVLTTVQPGDRIRVFYSGIAKNESGEQTFLEVDDLFYVIKATETLDDSISMELEVSSVDRVLQSPQKTMAETVQSVRQDQIRRAAGS